MRDLNYTWKITGVISRQMHKSHSYSKRENHTEHVRQGFRNRGAVFDLALPCQVMLTILLQGPHLRTTPLMELLNKYEHLRDGGNSEYRKAMITYFWMKISVPNGRESSSGNPLPKPNTY